MLKEYFEILQRPDQKVNPLFGYLGIKVEVMDDERCVLALPLRRDFLQGAGVVAGGVMSCLADEAMAHVVLANLDEGRTCTTIEMNLRFMKPVISGEIRAEATLVKKGRRVVTVAADVTDADGRLLAQAGASFMVIEHS